MKQRYVIVDRGHGRGLWVHDPAMRGYWRIVGHADGGLVNGDNAFSPDPGNDPTLAPNSGPTVGEALMAIHDSFAPDPPFQPQNLAATMNAISDAADAASDAATEQQSTESTLPPTEAAYKIEHDETMPAQDADERQLSLYGESARLYPQLIDPRKSLYDPRNWQPESAAELEKARTYMAIIAGRNGSTKWARPDTSKPIEMDAWNRLGAPAAQAADGSGLDPRITQFYQRGGNDPRQPFRDSRMYFRLGPFLNVGGGAVPAGNDTYIEFYGTR